MKCEAARTRPGSCHDAGETEYERRPTNDAPRLTIPILRPSPARRRGATSDLIQGEGRGQSHSQYRDQQGNHPLRASGGGCPEDHRELRQPVGARHRVRPGQDGAAAGTITNLSFSDEGVLTAVYSNGQAQDLAQIALAKFENPEAMFKVGNNRLKESRDSGTPSIGGPGTAGRGKLFAKSLERSTVDLATEFVNMIQNQRGFQANAKTITTTDELLNEVIQLKR